MKSDRAERLFLSATFITFLGNNIQLIATSLLVYRSVHSALSVGWVFILVAIPQVLFAAIFGRIADRFDRRKLCIITDIGSAITAAALPLAILLGADPSAAAYVTSFVLSLLAAMFMPASNALFKERVADGRLGNFSANYEIAYQGGALLSGAVGGLVAQLVGLSPLFYFNALTFLGSAACLLAIGRRMRAARSVQDAGPVASTAPAGLDSAEPEPPARDVAAPAPAGPAMPRSPVVRLAVLYAISIVLVTVANTLLLVAVVQRFRQGAGVLGVADALAGIGMIVSAMFYKRIKDRANYRYLIMVGLVGCAALAFAQPWALWTLLPGIFLGGLAFGIGRVPTRAELMRSIDEDKAGRVFGLTQASGLAASVVGTVIVATVIDHVGVIPGYFTLGLLAGVPALAVSVSLLRRRTPAARRPSVPDLINQR